MSTISRRRGFSLIELCVAVSLAIIVIGVATNVMVNTVRDGRRARVHSEMMRDAAFTGQLFSQELRQAGLGVPNGDHISNTYGTVAPARFQNAVIVAAANQIGIVGDLPRADATYNAYGALHNRTIDGGANVMWHTENNGACAPDLNPVGTTCTTADTSIFFPGEDGCDAAGEQGDRTCPWGMGRVEAGDGLVIVSGDGRWTHTTFVNTLTATAPQFVLAGAIAPAYATPWPPPPPPAAPVVAPSERCSAKHAGASPRAA